MPYKSKAQQRFFHAAMERGEIPKSTVSEYDKKTNFSRLPEKVKRKKHAFDAGMRAAAARLGLK